MKPSILVLIGLGCALGFAAARYGGVLPQDWNISLLVVALSATAFWLSGRPRQSAQPLLPKLLWPALLGLACVGIQLLPFGTSIVGWFSPARAEAAEALLHAGVDPGMITLSALPSATLPHLLRGLAYFLVMLTVREIAWRLHARPWAVCAPLLVVAAAEGALGVWQAGRPGSEIGAAGTFVNRNHYAGLLEICLPFAVMLAVSSFRRRMIRDRRWIFGCIAGLVATALILAGLMVSLSRAGFVIGLATLVLLGFGLLLNRDARVRTPSLPRGASAAALGASVLAAIWFLPSGALLERFASLAVTDELNTAFRVGLWRDSLSVFAAYPWFGCGLGAFRSAFSFHKTGAPTNDVDYAHNDYLQLLAELGVVGAILASLFLAGVTMFLFRRLRRERDIDARGLSLACLGSLAAIGLHSMVDFNLYIPANAFALAWVFGVALRPQTVRKAGRPVRPLELHHLELTPRGGQS